MTKKSTYITLFSFTCFLFGACSSTVVVPENVTLPDVPEYVKVPHPAGFELADLKAIFFSPMAPKAVLGEFSDTCDDEFHKLTSMTNSKEDRKKGAIELVTQDPERMHWCFYSKISKLQDTVQGDTTWNVRQKKSLDTFAFLGPIANAYVEVYKDSRYLRWASLYYSKISEWVFFKKVTPTPENTLTLIQNSRSDLEPWVQVQNRNETHSNSVFTKYGITLAPTVAGSGITNPINGTLNQQVNAIQEQPSRAPASVRDASSETTPSTHTTSPEKSTTPKEESSDVDFDFKVNED